MPSTATCNPRYLKPLTYCNHYHVYSIHIYIPREPHNLTLTKVLLSNILPKSLTSLHNFSSESATSAVQQQFQTFHKYHRIHLSHHTIHIHITQPRRYHTTLSPALTGNHSRIYHFYPDTRLICYLRFNNFLSLKALITTIFLLLHTLLVSATYRVDQ